MCPADLADGRTNSAGTPADEGGTPSGELAVQHDRRVHAAKLFRDIAWRLAAEKYLGGRQPAAVTPAKAAMGEEYIKAEQLPRDYRSE